MTFCRETEFQKTPVGKIPNEWHVVRLGEVGEVVSGFGFSLDYQGKKSGKYPFVKVGDMNLTSKYVTSAENYVDDEDLEALRAKAFPPNTLIFPKIGMAIYLNKYRILKVWGAFDNNVAGVIPKKIEPEFLFYCFVGRVDLKQLSSRTTAPSIRKTTLESTLIPLPSVEEQRGIVGVLGVVDLAVAKAGEVIWKTERLKKGLMQTLLTRGIGHKEYKQTPIGTTPKTWQIAKLEDASFDFIGGGTPSTSNPDYWDGDIAWMTSAHINGRIITSGQRYITKEGLENSATHVIPRDNLLVATRVGIGKAAVNKIDIAISQDLTGVIIDKDKALPDFLYWVIVNNERRLKSIAQGSTIKGILREDLGRLLIPKPPLPEQQEIAEILSTVDKKLELEKKEKSRLERIKQGLMDLLLTGEIRVKVD